MVASSSLYLLSTAVQTLPVGTAYAVWTGIGSAGSRFCSLQGLSSVAKSPFLAACAVRMGLFWPGFH
ncbi:SMR family transporter [Brevibacillus sp. BC25]|uniref:SMR family transporter n=1 Tax=Brevibacillus sp. BC25 TaxID=1144308 RepID=UPI0009D9AFD5